MGISAEDALGHHTCTTTPPHRPGPPPWLAGWRPGQPEGRGSTGATARRRGTPASAPPRPAARRPRRCRSRHGPAARCGRRSVGGGANGLGCGVGGLGVVGVCLAVWCGRPEWRGQVVCGARDTSPASQWKSSIKSPPLMASRYFAVQRCRASTALFSTTFCTPAASMGDTASLLTEMRHNNSWQ